LSAASGINDAGAVVGLSYTATNAQHAFLWTEAGGTQDLTPDLTSIGGATAVAIDSTNQVVGYYYPNGSQSTIGFLWTQEAGLQNLGPAGTLALAINNSGTVVDNRRSPKDTATLSPGPQTEACKTWALWVARKAPHSASTIKGGSSEPP